MAKKKRKTDYTHRIKRSKKGGLHLTGPLTVESILSGESQVGGVGKTWSWEKSILGNQGTRPHATKRQIKRGQFDKVENKAKRK